MVMDLHEQVSWLKSPKRNILIVQFTQFICLHFCIAKSYCKKCWNFIKDVFFHCCVKWKSKGIKFLHWGASYALGIAVLYYTSMLM